MAVPPDGRITSLTLLTGPLTGTEVMEVVSPGNAAQGNSFQVTTQTVANAANDVGTTGYTVATLPAATAALRGKRTFVTDAAAATYQAGAAVTGGGANVIPVFCNGTAWVAG